MVKAAADDAKYCRHVASHQTTQATFFMHFFNVFHVHSKYMKLFLLIIQPYIFYSITPSVCLFHPLFIWSTLGFFYTYAIEQVCIIFLCTTGCM